MRFKGKIAIVTGAGQGIGEAYAKALAREGAAVVVADINGEKGRAVAAEITSGGGRAAFVETDVSSPESAEELAARTVSEFGGIDYLINNAAIFAGMRRETLLNVDYAYYKRFMEVNMNGVLIVTRAVYKHIAARGGGAIVNQSSSAWRRSWGR
jgi:3-oxoacyl-[acyl-carrier protein] reductase